MSFISQNLISPSIETTISIPFLLQLLLNIEEHLKRGKTSSLGRFVIQWDFRAIHRAK